MVINVSHVHVVWEGAGKWLVRKERQLKVGMGSDGQFCNSYFQEKVELATNGQSVQLYRYEVETRHVVYQFVFFSLCFFVFVVQYFYSSWVVCIVFWSHSPTPVLDLLSIVVIKHRPKPTWEGKDLFQLKGHSPLLKKPRDELEVGTMGECCLLACFPCFPRFACTTQDHLLSDGSCR